MKQLELQLIEINKRLDVLTDAVNTGGGGIIDPCCPATNTLLGEIKTIIQEVEVSINETHDTFQILDCAGLPIGTPQDVEKTVVLNKIITSICNVEDLATAIGNAIVFPIPIEYNTAETIIVNSLNSPYNINSNYFHEISIRAKGTSCKRNTGGILIDMFNGEVFSYSVTNKNGTACSFEVSGADEILIDLIK